MSVEKLGIQNDHWYIKQWLERNELRCRTPADVEILEILRQKFKWIPGKANIRPNPKVLDEKFKYMENIRHFYESQTDYIYESVFKFDTVFNESGKLIVKRQAIIKKQVFEINKFAYSLEKGTHHYIMWYSYWDDTVSDKKIDSDVSNAIKLIAKHNHYDYIWYENPKMTIPDIYHVQVFWTDNSGLAK